ncbi:MAG: hypothetical protein KDA69_02665 [Planctomycetaceae bacterium]|nr:hypothetical protein [Planctomycetaceae bacterium]MCA9043192.1 hypothetical protein [Planctomycetaceae bacterium]MCB9949449.1 hypothetical protein [Planctomycetaceae bacterium]
MRVFCIATVVVFVAGCQGSDEGTPPVDAAQQEAVGARSPIQDESELHTSESEEERQRRITRGANDRILTDLNRARVKYMLAIWWDEHFQNEDSKSSLLIAKEELEPFESKAHREIQGFADFEVMVAKFLEKVVKHAKLEMSTEMAQTAGDTKIDQQSVRKSEMEIIRQSDELTSAWTEMCGKETLADVPVPIDAQMEYWRFLKAKGKKLDIVGDWKNLPNVVASEDE